MPIAHCIECGCHDYAACFDREEQEPCHWLVVNYGEGVGVCSACPEGLARWDAGDHSFAVPIESASRD